MGNMEALKIRPMPRILSRCAATGLLMTIGCALLQVLCKRTILGISGRPEPAFLAQVFACYFITGFLFALGFLRFGGAMPGRTTLARAFIYAAVVNVAVFLGNIVNLIAFDYSGLFDLFTRYKVLQYATALADLVNFLIASLYLAALVKDLPVMGTPRKIKKREIVSSAIVGAFLFPTMGYGVFQLMDALFPTVFAIPAAARTWFSIGLWIPIVPTTGVFVPLFTLFIQDSIKGGTIHKSMKIAWISFLLYWLPGALFLLPFGYSLAQTAAFLAIMIPPLFLVTLSTAWISRAIRGTGSLS